MSISPHPLAGQRALVTGGAHRLGQALVEALVAAGASVVIHHHRSLAKAEALATRLRRQGAVVETLAADLDDPAVVDRAIARTDALLGPVDLLINNAASFAADDLRSTRWEDWQASFRLNTWAPFALTRAFADGREGSVINLLDCRVSADPDPVHLSYSLAKAMLADLTRLCARTFAPRVRVNAVAPGAVLPPPGEDAETLARLAAATPLGRPVPPAAVAAAVLHLATNPAVTGQTLFVDSGSHLGDRP